MEARIYDRTGILEKVKLLKAKKIYSRISEGENSLI